MNPEIAEVLAGTPALSLWQPWASLIDIGAKPEETRSWPAPQWLIGKRLAIHAAKKPIEQATADLPDLVMETMVRALVKAKIDPMNLPLGKVVCTAVLTGCGRVVRREDGHVIDHGGRRSPINHFGDFGIGRWLWYLDKIERVEPFAVTGRQGVFRLPASSRIAEADSHLFNREAVS